MYTVTKSKLNFVYRGYKPHELRASYLETIRKELLGEQHFRDKKEIYEMVVKLLDLRDEYSIDPIVLLVQQAEQVCLYKNGFDPADWLKDNDLAQYMELDNEERAKFGIQTAWTDDMINLARLGKLNKF